MKKILIACAAIASSMALTGCAENELEQYIDYQLIAPKTLYKQTFIATLPTGCDLYEFSLRTSSDGVKYYGHRSGTILMCGSGPTMNTYQCGKNCTSETHVLGTPEGLARAQVRSRQGTKGDSK